MNKIIRQKDMTGAFLQALCFSIGGGIAKAFLTLLLMFVTMAASAQTQLEGSGTEQDPYQIWHDGDWYTIAEGIKNGTIRSDAHIVISDNISTVTNPKVMLGTPERPFTGTFDGNGKRMALGYHSNDGFIAPFGAISGATIKNLYIDAGDIYVSQPTQYCAGMVSQAVGNPSYISNCHCTVNLRWDANSQRDMSWGGILGIAKTTVYIDNCIFDGQILEEKNPPDARAFNTGGFVGWSDQAVYIKHSLVNAKIQSSSVNDGRTNFSNATFARGNGVSVEDSYWVPDKIEYYTNHYIYQGTAMSLNDPKMKDGSVAYTLQGNQDTQYWGQTIGRDGMPSQSKDSNKRVFRAAFTAGDNIVYAVYANTGNKFPLTGRYAALYDGQPATKDVYYSAFKIDNEGYALIGDSVDWNLLTLSNPLKGKFRMTADFTVDKMIPSFSGSFDGQGHTLTVNYSATEERLSPFRYINGANISNLRVAGSITTDKGPGSTGGLAGEATGDASTFTNCESAVNLTFTGNGDATLAGFLGRANTNGSVAFNSCAFTGSITAANGHSVAGFVGWINSGNVTIDHSLSAGNITALDGGGTGNAPFARNAGGSTVTNSYYRDFANINGDYRRGTLASDSLLTSGEVAYALQNSLEQQYWGQTTGTDPLPLFTSNPDKRVYKADFMTGNDVAFTTYATKGQTFPMPNVPTGVSYLKTSKVADVTATKDTQIDYDNSITLQLPKNSHYTVTATVGDKPVKDGDHISGSADLKFYVTPTPDLKLLTDSVLTMFTGGRGVFVPFEEPKMLAAKGGYGIISSKEDWDLFAKYASVGNFRLTTDLDGITSMMGSVDRPFKGTFDGQGHTLTVNYDYYHEPLVAPFRVISGSTIKNIRIAGTIRSSKQFCGGIVGQVKDSASCIYNCQSSVNMTWIGDFRKDMTWGGIVGIAYAGVSIDNCIFDGGIYDRHVPASRPYNTGGFVGWSEQNADIKNSLMAGKIQSYGMYRLSMITNATFARGKATVENSYWLSDNIEYWQYNYTYQGTQLDGKELLQSGAITYNLQSPQKKQCWGQTIGTDMMPMLSADTIKHVYKASLMHDNKEFAVSYANKGMVFPKPHVANYMFAFDNTIAASDTTIAINALDPVNDIASKADWDNFTTNYNGTGNYRLTADITDPVSTTAGTDAVPFSGTFYGDGHTLNVDITSDQSFTAPFRHVRGATIRDLKVTGKIHQTGTTTDACNHASGLCGRTDGVTLEKCISSVALTFDISGDVHTGGLVGHALSSTININDCAFTGSFSEQPGGSNASIGGLIAWGERNFKANISNSYVNATLINIPGQNNLVRAYRWGPGGSQFTNCYYTIPDGVTDYDPEPATKVTAEQMQNGYVANMLQNGHAKADGMVWGQTINGEKTDTLPVLTTDASKLVYKASFTFEGDEIASVCANAGYNFPMLTSVKYVSIEPKDYTSQAASKDIKVAMNLFNKNNVGYWLINDADDWNTFAAYCTKGSFSLGKDISNITTPAATKQRPFAGTFDGQGYTLSVNYDFADKTDAEQDAAAPFRAINGATIKNVRTAGVIITKKGTSDAAGLVGESTGNVNINNCESAVDITYSGTGDATNGGLIGRINDNSNVTVNNCAFTGSLKSAQGNSFGGLIGWAQDNNVAVAISNSLVAADIEVQNSNNAYGNAPFARNASKTTVNNCYYRDFNNIYDGYRKGTTVTDEQLKSGEVAYMLQGTTQKTQAWGQTIGTDDMPQLTSEAAKRVIENVYDDNSKIYDNFLAINEDKGNKSVISANKAAKGNVKLVRKFAEGWNTLVVPFDVPTDSVNKVFGKDVKVAYFTNNTPNTIELSTKTDTKDITANEPVLVYVSEDFDTSANTFIFNGVTVKDAEAKAEGMQGISFVGSYDSLYTVKEGEYFISGTNLWKSQGNTSLKATRAYFTMPEASAGAKIMLRINDGTTTGISSVRSEESGDRGYGSAVYTLSGQKVADSLEDARKINLKQGVYIVNGKKMVIK